MTTAPIRAIMTSSNSSSDGLHGDIVTFAMENNFGAVDAVLANQSEQINAQREGSGITALMAASGRGMERMVVHLLSKPGIDTTIVDETGRTALDHGRIFPGVVAKIMKHRNPGMKWSEPEIRPI